jgi:hypothetical protein
MKTGERRGTDGPWKTKENQNQVSLRFPPPLEIAARFPHSHRADYETLSPQKKQPRKPTEKEPPHRASPFPSFRPILRLAGCGKKPIRA